MADQSIRTTAMLVCPLCGESKKVEMPIDACQHFYQCQKCHQIIKPKSGDCCVFCSYADSKCPPKQAEAQQQT